MKVLICSEARPLLEEYHDEQLPVGDQIAVRAHLEWCDDCAAIVSDLRLMAGLVRAGSPGQARLTQDDSVAFQSAVVSRARAEARASWPSRMREMLEDMRIVYAGIGAAVATVFCVIVLLSMMRFATRERPNSLAAIIALLAAPKVTTPDPNAPGTDQNPVVVDAQMLMPRALDQLFLSTAPGADEVFTLSAVVTREGRIMDLQWHSASGNTPKAGTREAEAVDTVLSAASLARFEPARVAGLPVAVKMVWLVANTTVRASKTTLELPDTGGVPAPTPHKRRVTVTIPPLRHSTPV
jgi:Putative zinc-finger